MVRRVVPGRETSGWGGFFVLLGRWVGCGCLFRLSLNGPASVDCASDGFVFVIVFDQSGCLIHAGVANDVVNLCGRVQRYGPIGSYHPFTCLATLLRYDEAFYLFLQIMMFVANVEVGGQAFLLQRRDARIGADLRTVTRNVLDCVARDAIVVVKIVKGDGLTSLKEVLWVAVGSVAADNGVFVFVLYVNEMGFR